MFGFGKSRVAIEDVAQQVIARLEAREPGRKYRFHDDIDVIKGPDGSATAVGNLYEEYLATADRERARLLDRFVAAIQTPRESPGSLAAASANLLPAFRNLYGFDASRISSGLARPEDVTGSLLPFSDELAVSIVVDSAQAMAMVDPATLHRWNCTPQEALDVALGNLRRRSPPKFTQAAPGLFLAQYGDEYDAVRLLLPDLVTSLPLKGAPVAMVPNRALLVVAGDQDVQAMATLLQVAGKTLREEPRPLGSELLRLEEGRWQPCHPEGPLGTGLGNLRREVRFKDYAAQKAALEHVLRPQGDDAPYVAEYKVLQKKTGELLGYAVLTRGVRTLLPRADVVVLVDDPHAQPPKTKIVPWTEFEREAGTLLEPVPHALPRYRVEAHPTPDMIDRMAVAELGG